jgi:hypothetical protein
MLTPDPLYSIESETLIANGDILTGIFVGAGVGGWEAFASVYAGAAVASGLGR